MDHRVRLLRFSVFELDLERRELRRRGVLVPLPPQPFAVLELLLQNAGQVVTREELRLALWPEGVHVDYERGLNYCVNRVRRALGDEAQVPRFLETLPRRGYRFLAEVDVVRTGENAAPLRLRPAAAPTARPAARPPSARVRRPLVALAAALLLATQGQLERHSEPGRPGLPSLDPTAQAAFRRGRQLLDEGPAGWRQSVAWFEDAARRDRRFALARYGLADAYMRLGENGVLLPADAFPRARRAAHEALAIEDRAEPLVILAALQLNYDWDGQGAERTIRRALALDPELVEAQLFYARLLSASARHDEALRIVREAKARRPGCPVVVRDSAFLHYRARHFDEAARRFGDWAALEPGKLDPHHWLALLHLLTGRTLDAKREGRIVLTRGGATAAYLVRFDALAPAPAMALYVRGSIRYLERLASTQSVTPDDFARLRAHLGDREEALRDLRRAADERSPRLLPYLADPAFDALRSDPRFQALVLRVRVPARSDDRVG
jgi:DNA-binding winged helix-turn-helix (wHTH) protein